MSDRGLLHRHPLWAAAVAAVVVLSCLVWALLVLGRPLPPRTLVLSTGPEGGAYREYGEQYRAALAKDGIDLELGGRALGPRGEGERDPGPEVPRPGPLHAQAARGARPRAARGAPA